MKMIMENAWLLSLGNANAVLMRDQAEFTLIDAGFPNKEQVVFDALRHLGARPSDLKHFVFTHGHPDHIGSAAAIVKATGARTYMHALDAPLAESGGPFRPMSPAKGLMHHIAYRSFWHEDERMQPFRIDQTIADGETLDVAGGLQVIATPGHCAGQVAFLWGGDRLLVGGDVFMNLFGVSDPIGFEDEAEGHRSQRKIARLAFDVAAFGHGPAITSNAAKHVRHALKETV